MLTFKIAGAFTLLFITLYLCYEASRMEFRRLRQTEGFLLLIRHVKAQISCFCTPLAEIFAEFENSSLEAIGFTSALREGGFSYALEKCKDKIYLDTERINMLANFGEELGKSYREEQIECCDYYIGELENAYTKTRDEQPRRAKLYRSLLLTGGLMVIIVFI